MTDPDAQPFLWVKKWMENHENKYFGYLLSDDSICVMCRDGTHLIRRADNFNVHYIDPDDELNCTVSSYPPHLEAKINLVTSILCYMKNLGLVKATDVRLLNVKQRPPYVQRRYRSQMAIVMLLSNGSVQVRIW